MNGIELARAFYDAYGAPMLEREFSDVRDRIAVGIAGHGSECFGYDDETSRDHDFEPGFCLWITDEDERRFGFRLFRAYNRLPTEFEGVRIERRSALGSPYKGVHTVREFYSYYTGTGDVPETNADWLAIAPLYLAEATNGAVFSDPLGEFSRIRRALLSPPEDVRLARLASSLFYMAQAGQYNYPRCIRHGEYAAAATALSDFAKSAAETVFFLNRRHPPYYKWLFRGLRELPLLGELEEDLTGLLRAPFDAEQNVPVIERIAERIAAALREEGLATLEEDCYLEPYAREVHGRIADPALRRAPLML